MANEGILKRIWDLLASFPNKAWWLSHLPGGGGVPVEYQYQDGDSETDIFGNAILGGDGTNLQLIKTDAAGNLQVDVLTGGGGEQHTDNEAVNIADLGNLVLGTDGSNYQILHTDAAGDVQVDVLSSALPSGAATSANQTTGNNSLSNIDGHVHSIDGKITACDTGSVTVVADPALDYTTDDVQVYGSQNVTLQQKLTSNDLICTLDGEDVTVTPKAASTWDVSDRAARDLGGVDILAELPAGTQLIGKVGIDQTTPGTTNAVDVLDRAARLVGKVYGDQGVLVQSADVNKDLVVKIRPELPAGTQNIGDVDVASIAAGANTIGRVRVVDHADAEMALADADAVTHAIPIMTKFIADPSALAANQGKAFLCDRNGLPLVCPPDFHYTVQGKAFGAVSPAAGLVIASMTATDVCLISNGATRLNYMNHIRVDSTGDPVLVELSRVPTVKAVGTGVTPANRYTGSATAATCSVYYSPTITAQGSIFAQGIADDNAPYIFEPGAGKVGCLDYNAGRLLIRVTPVSGTAGATIWWSLAWVEVGV